MRVINYPARGIGNTTIENYWLPLITTSVPSWGNAKYRQNWPEIEFRNQTKLLDFVTMIQSFQVINENQDAFLYGSRF
jgi:DNA helicase-2/ATP-dependent DNA helicase PcrA